VNVTFKPTSPLFPRYSLAERDRRWRLARDLMEEEGLDALLVVGERNLDIGAPLLAPDAYLSNDRPGAYVLFPRNRDPIALVWSAQVVAAHAIGELRGEGSWIAPEDMWVGRTPQRFAQVAADCGLQKSRIGVVGLEGAGPGGESFISYLAWSGISKALPDVTFVPVWRKFARIMLIKSEEEIAVLRQAAGAGEHMCEALLRTARPGVSEAELYSAALSASLEAGAVSSWLILQTGKDNVSWGPPSWVFRPTMPRVVEDGDVILTELFPSYGLVETQQQMAIAVGKVDVDVERCAAAAREGYEAGLQACRPGATFGEVSDAMVKPVNAVNGWFLTPQVHSLNPITAMSSRAAYGIENLVNSDRYPKIDMRAEQNRDTVLQAGMTFAFETNCHLGGRRVNIGGTVLVSESGAEELNTLANHMQRV
jgi:Xaa-Pro dipeptidase